MFVEKWKSQKIALFTMLSPEPVIFSPKKKNDVNVTMTHSVLLTLSLTTPQKTKEKE